MAFGFRDEDELFRWSAEGPSNRAAVVACQLLGSPVRLRASVVSPDGEVVVQALLRDRHRKVAYCQSLPASEEMEFPVANLHAEEVSEVEFRLGVTQMGVRMANVDQRWHADEDGTRVVEFFSALEVGPSEAGSARLDVIWLDEEGHGQQPCTLEPVGPSVSGPGQVVLCFRHEHDLSAPGVASLRGARPTLRTGGTQWRQGVRISVAGVAIAAAPAPLGEPASAAPTQQGSARPSQSAPVRSPYAPPPEPPPDPKSVKGVGERLRGNDPADLAVACNEAREGNMTGHVPRLRTLAGDGDPGVRAAAAEALGWLGGKSLVIPLRKLLTDSDPEVVKAATAAIDRLMAG